MNEMRHCQSHNEDEWNINAVADKYNISHRTLRFYENYNLIQPRRTETHNRFYSRKTRVRLEAILALKKLCFTLKEIGELLPDTHSDSPIDIYKLLAKVPVKKVAHIRHLKSIGTQITEAIQLLENI